MCMAGRTNLLPIKSYHIFLRNIMFVTNPFLTPISPIAIGSYVIVEHRLQFDTQATKSKNPYPIGNHFHIGI